MTMLFWKIYDQLISKEEGGKVGTSFGGKVYFYDDFKKFVVYSRKVLNGVGVYLVKKGVEAQIGSHCCKKQHLQKEEKVFFSFR